MNSICERRDKTKGKGVQGGTKFKRELKKLEWNVQEKSNRGGPNHRGKGVSNILVMKVRILSGNVRGANDATKRNLFMIFSEDPESGRGVSLGNEMEILLQ